MTKQYPVVLFVFKRPSTTKELLDRIAKSGADKIYLFADGPRNDEEKMLTSEVKKVINDFSLNHQNIMLIATYSRVNLGLKKSIVKGLGTVFSRETAALILEDDCLPSSDYFKFTQTLLNKYLSSDRIMSIAGTSVGSFSQNSYDFSRYQLCWGWATWARAWKLYDPDLKALGSPKWQHKLSRITRLPHMRWYWNMILSIVKRGWLKTWDYQWTYSLFIKDGLAIIPSCNLVSNVGFDNVATNTQFKSRLSNLAMESLKWPLKHPVSMQDNIRLSECIEKNFYNNPVAILGMLRQYFYWKWNNYANRH